MNDAIGYFILCRVWSRILRGPVFAEREHALQMVGDLKDQIILECSNGHFIEVAQRCHSWASLQEIPEVPNV